MSNSSLLKRIYVLQTNVITLVSDILCRLLMIFQHNLEYFLVRKVSFIRCNGRLFATLDLFDEFSLFTVLMKEVSEYLNTVKVHGFIFLKP